MLSNVIIDTNEVEDFFSYIDVSKQTEITYRESLKNFMNFLGDNKRPTRQDILRYKEYLMSMYKPTTVNVRLIAIKQFFKWLAFERIYPNITENIKQVEVGIIEKNYPTLEEIKHILSTINNDYDKALFSLLIGTGLRLKEVANADIEDIKELHGEKVLYVQGKGRQGKEEYVKLSNTLLNTLNRVINERKTRSNIYC